MAAEPVCDKSSTDSGVARAAFVRVAILTALWVWMFLPELREMFSAAVGNSNWAHALAAPAVIAVLLTRRRQMLAQAATAGSLWGVVLLLVSLALYALSTWPFVYRYVQMLAIVPALGGLILAGAGWGVLKRTLPLLLVLLVCLPIAPRLYAALIIRPETYTLSAAQLVLQALPNVAVELKGPDLIYRSGQQTGTIALGESQRGAMLLTAYLVVILLVVFAHVRPMWHVLCMAVAAGPIMLACNLLRVVCWGVITIYCHLPATSGIPRAAAAIFSLAAAYVASGLICAILSTLAGEELDDVESEVETAGA